MGLAIPRTWLPLARRQRRALPMQTRRLVPRLLLIATRVSRSRPRASIVTVIEMKLPANQLPAEDTASNRSTNERKPVLAQTPVAHPVTSLLVTSPATTSHRSITRDHAEDRRLEREVRARCVSLPASSRIGPVFRLGSRDQRGRIQGSPNWLDSTALHLSALNEEAGDDYPCTHPLPG
jgi:hypothetical protein